MPTLTPIPAPISTSTLTQRASTKKSFKTITPICGTKTIFGTKTICGAKTICGTQNNRPICRSPNSKVQIASPLAE